MTICSMHLFAGATGGAALKGAGVAALRPVTASRKSEKYAPARPVLG